MNLPDSSDPITNSEESASLVLENGSTPESIEEAGPSGLSKETEKVPEWVEWRETLNSGDLPNEKSTSDVASDSGEAENEEDKVVLDVHKCEPSEPTNIAAEALPESGNGGPLVNPSESTDPVGTSSNFQPSTSGAAAGDGEDDKIGIKNGSK